MSKPRQSIDCGIRDPDTDDCEIRVGVSSCLLGEHVRYDGGHKHDRYLTEVLGRYFRFVAVCPEVEVGMGTPREPVRMVRQGETIRMVGASSGDDHTVTPSVAHRATSAAVPRTIHAWFGT